MEFLHYFIFFLFSFLFLLHPFFLRKFKKFPPSPPLRLPLIDRPSVSLQETSSSNLSKDIQQYGPVLLLQFGSRPVLLVSSPSAAEECFTKNDIVFANRLSLLAGKHLGYNYTTLVWASYGDHWRNLRRIASMEILSTHRINTFADIRRDEVLFLVKRLLREASEDEYEVVEMKTAFFEMMLNVMMGMIGGKRYYGDDSGNLEDRRKFKEIVKETFELSGATNVGDFVPILRWIGMDKLENKLKVLQEKRDNFMQGLIDEHRKMKGFDEQRNKTLMGSEEERDKTLIDVLLSLQGTDPDSYKDEIIRGMMQVLVT